MALLGLDTAQKRGIFAGYVLLWVSSHLLVYSSRRAGAPPYNPASVVLLTEVRPSFAPSLLSPAPALVSTRTVPTLTPTPPTSALLLLALLPPPLPQPCHRDLVVTTALLPLLRSRRPARTGGQARPRALALLCLRRRCPHHHRRRLRQARRARLPSARAATQVRGTSEMAPPPLAAVPHTTPFRRLPKLRLHLLAPRRFCPRQSRRHTRCHAHSNAPALSNAPAHSNAPADTSAGTSCPRCCTAGAAGLVHARPQVQHEHAPRPTLPRYNNLVYANLAVFDPGRRRRPRLLILRTTRP